VLGRAWTRLIGLAFGYGISENIADAYIFLMKNFQPGDMVFIFGFSRGAYTARALGGLLHMFGLLTEGNEGLIPYALRLFKSADRNKFQLAAGFKRIFSRPCAPHFLGLWDTVSSVGWIFDPVGLKPWRMPYTAQFPDIPLIRHAISIDERRAFFRQNLIHPPASPAKQDLQQVWFAGDHSDVGGSYPEPNSGLSKLALRWIFCEAANAGLLLDQSKVAAVLGADSRYAPPSPTAQIHNSLTPVWWLAEFWPKRCMVPTPVPGQTKPDWRVTIRFNLGRRRWIEDGACLHESVLERIRLVPQYRPPNLPKQYTVAKDDCSNLSQLSAH